MKLIARIVGGLIALALMGIAGLLIFGTASRPPELLSVNEPLRRVDYSDLPSLLHFKARDGQALSYRLYPGAGQDAAVLIHGSSGESTAMHRLAKALSVAGLTVYVPDLRGHGHDGRPGDIDYIGQLDDDLADLAAVIRGGRAQGELSLVGHSSGGGFVLRIAEGPYARWFSRFILLSPALAFGAETYRPDSGGWAKPFVGRIIALQVLNTLGVRWWNGLPIVGFAIDPNAPVPLDATYFYRMLADFSAPQDSFARLPVVKQPIEVLVGGKDEIFYADRFAPLIHRVRADVPVTVLSGVDHIGMVTDPEALAAVVAVLQGKDVVPP